MFVVRVPDYSSGFLPHLLIGPRLWERHSGRGQLPGIWTALSQWLGSLRLSVLQGQSGMKAGPEAGCFPPTGDGYCRRRENHPLKNQIQKVLC